MKQEQPAPANRDYRQGILMGFPMKEAESQSSNQLGSLKAGFNQILCANSEITASDSQKSLEGYEFFLKALLNHLS
jgi:hypothetical protein